MANPAPRTARDAHDVALVARVAGGDVAAFAELYDRHASTLLALALRILRNDSDAHDLIHDAFLEAWRAAHDFDPARGSVRTWLSIRVRSRALDVRARARRERGAYDRWLVADCERTARTPPTERQVAIRQALSALDPRVRHVLELTYFDGMTAPEVAREMGMPEGTVRSRLAKGLETLQQMLDLLEENEP